MSKAVFLLFVSFFSAHISCASCEDDRPQIRKHGREETYGEKHDHGEKRQRHLGSQETLTPLTQAKKDILTFQEACACLPAAFAPCLPIYEEKYPLERMSPKTTLQERCVEVLLRCSEKHATLGNLEPIKFLRRQTQAYPELAKFLFEGAYFRPKNPTLSKFLRYFSKLKFVGGDSGHESLAWQNFSFLSKSPYLHSFEYDNLSEDYHTLGFASLTLLKKLAHLSVLDDTIEDLSFLSQMEQLQSLDLKVISLNTKAVECDQLQGLTHLTSLKIGVGYDVCESLLQALVGVAPLTHLEIGNSSVHSVHEINLSGFPNAIKNLHSLTSVTLVGHDLRYVSSLATCTNLRVLNLRDNRVKTLEPLWSLAGLTSLDVSDNSLSSACFASLRGLTSLTYLNMSDCYEHVTTLQPLASLTCLQTLKAKRTIFEPKSFEGLTSLTSLSVGDKNLKNFEPFFTLGSLSHLRVGRSAIMIPTVQTLTRLSGLRSLGLKRNGAPWIDGDLSNFVPLTQLRHLDLRKASLGSSITSQTGVISWHEDLRTLNALGHLQQLTLTWYDVASELQPFLLRYPFLTFKD